MEIFCYIFNRRIDLYPIVSQNCNQMKNKVSFPFLLMVSLLFQSNLIAQEKIKFGKIDKAQLKMTRYEQDSSAHAVVLSDIGNVRFVYDQMSGNGFQIHFERHKRIKIFDEKGLDYANVEIRLYEQGTQEEKLTNFKAITYNLNGNEIEKTKFSNSAMYREQADKNWSVRKAALPGVKDGSVIEYRYTVVSDFLFNIDDWYFQSTIPIVWSEYEITVPEYFYYNKTFRGYEFGDIIINTEKNVSDGIQIRGSTQTIDYRSTVYHWASQHVPAFHLEPYSTTPKNYLGRVEFELSRYEIPGVVSKNYNTSWEDINDKLMFYDEFGGQLNKANLVATRVQAAVNEGDEPVQKIGKIFEYVKKNYQWDGNYRKFVTISLRHVQNKGGGSSADINFMFMAMLRAAGLQVDPILVSTRSNGFINPVHPSQSQFNHVIAGVHLGEDILLVDATHQLLPATLLPPNSINDRGRLISKKGSYWVNLNAKRPYKKVVQAKVGLGEAMTLEGSIKSALTDYAAYNFRVACSKKDSETDYLKGLEEAHEGLEILEHSFENLSNVYERVKCDYEVKITDQLVDGGDMMYFSPMLYYGIDENPFKLEQRNYPVDYAYPINETYVLQFDIPEGYEIEELPESTRLALPDKTGFFSYSANAVANQVQIRSIFKINKSIFIPDEYLALKEFYNLIVEKHGEQIVLRKKT